MKADIRWLDDPQVFRVNRLDAHSDHKFYENKEDYEKKEQRLKQSLNGIWKFRYSENAMERPADFYQKWFQCRSFDEMKVPQHIELAGYDKIHYINTMYPWEGHIYRRPAGTGKEKGKGMFSQAEYNPVGSYIRKFDLQDGLRGKRIILSFEGCNHRHSKSRLFLFCIHTRIFSSSCISFTGLRSRISVMVISSAGISST